MNRQVNRRILSALVVSALMLVSLHGNAENNATPQQVSAVHEKVILQVSDASVAKLSLTLTNARNVQAAFGKNNVEVEIVVFGPGVDLLKFESELGDNINKAIEDGVKIVACENTMKGKNLVKADMLSSIGYVQSGVVELINKQHAGWAYVRP